MRRWGRRSRLFPFTGRWRRSFRQSPLRFGALWSAGWLLYQNKDYPAAIQDWDQLKKMEPNFRWMEKVLYWKGQGPGKNGPDPGGRRKLRPASK